MTEHIEHRQHAPGVDGVHSAHNAHAGVESAEALWHLARGAHGATSGFSPLSAFMGPLGIGLGMAGVGIGIDEMVRGEYSQGALDIVSGGLGTVASTATMMAGAGGGMATTGLATAALPLTIAAGLAALGAYGNQDAQKDGMYGKDRGGHENATFLDSIGIQAEDGWHSGNGMGHALLGDNIAGDAVGGVLGGALGLFGGIGQTVGNSGSAVYAGGRKVVRNVMGLFGDEEPAPVGAH